QRAGEVGPRGEGRRAVRAARRAVARRRLPLPAPDAWALVTDVRNHARWVPLTRIDAAPRLAVGDRFVAVTGPRARRRGWGLLGRMAVERAGPPDPPWGSPGRAVSR